MLEIIVFILCIPNSIAAIYHKNWSALCGWLVASIGWAIVIGL